MIWALKDPVEVFYEVRVVFSITVDRVRGKDRPGDMVSSCSQ